MRSVGKNGYRSENIWNRLIFKTESIDVKKDSCMKTYEDSFFMSGKWTKYRIVYYIGRSFAADK